MKPTDNAFRHTQRTRESWLEYGCFPNAACESSQIAGKNKDKEKLCYAKFSTISFHSNILFYMISVMLCECIEIWALRGPA